MPDNSINLILTDPPYGIGESNEKNLSRQIPSKVVRLNTAKHKRDYGHYTWDKKKLTKPYFTEMLRVSKNQIIFGGQSYANWLPPSYGWIVWDKKRDKNDFSDCELAYTSFKRGIRIFRWLWDGCRKEHPETRWHPTQKPLALIEWIILHYSHPNDLILDPFLGSGTTALAALKLNRRFIGYELSPEYCRIAENRIKDWRGQQRIEDYPSTSPLPFSATLEAYTEAIR